jgi:hypothetical protein
VAWLAMKTDQTAACRLVRIDWATVGRIIERVAGDAVDDARLQDLFEISIDEVAWRKGHRYLTLVGDHQTGKVVWGCDGKGAAAAGEFFDALDPPPAPAPRSPAAPVWSCMPPEPGRDAPRSLQPAGIMVPFGPCSTRLPVDQHGIQAAWLDADAEIDPSLFARASRLTAVSMDMTGGYAKAVRERAPQAEIVIDNYHVVALASKALDEVRRASLKRAARPGRHGRRPPVQARPLGAAQEPGRPEPSITVRSARQDDPQAPSGDPRGPPAEPEQRPRGGAEQQGEADRPPRLRISQRPRRARARSPHLRASHTHTPTQTNVPVISPTTMPGEPDLLEACDLVSHSWKQCSA